MPGDAVRRLRPRLTAIDPLLDLSALERFAAARLHEWNVTREIVVDVEVSVGSVRIEHADLDHDLSPPFSLSSRMCEAHVGIFFPKQVTSHARSRHAARAG